MSADRASPRGRMGLWIFLLLLSVCPVVAVAQVVPRSQWLGWGGTALGVSLLSFVVYRNDKRRAEKGRQRVPEAYLHVLSLVGGWPGAFLAQRWLRHKTSKMSFQVIFWMIVFGYQVVAIEVLTGGQTTGRVWRALTASWS